MGSSLGPVLANIWMTHLEETYINNSEFFPSYYRRYVDDTFCVFRQKDHISKFHAFLNTLNASTKFDMELEENGKLAFLDTIVSRKELSGNPDISTKIKATDKGLYYDFVSFIPDQYKSNLVCGAVHRVYQIASSYEIMHLDIKRLCSKLYGNGFPKDFVERCVARVLDGVYTPKVPVPTVQRKEILMVMPYLGQMSVVLKRNICQLVRKFYPTVDVKIVFKRGYQINNMFNFKDRFPLKCASGVIYYIECKKCEQSAAYLGKTINTLYERFYGSNGHLNPKTVNSALLDHCSESGDPDCKFNFDDIKVLDSCNKDYQLRIIESVLLKYEKQTLNVQEYSFPLKLV